MKSDEQCAVKLTQHETSHVSRWQAAGYTISAGFVVLNPQIYTTDVKKPSCNLCRTNRSLRRKICRLITTSLDPRDSDSAAIPLWRTVQPTYMDVNILKKMEMKYNFSSEGKVLQSHLWCRFAPSIYLILVRATALLSVFWNKARIRFFTSELENSSASGPLPSAHLWRGSTGESADRAHQ